MRNAKHKDTMKKLQTASHNKLGSVQDEAIIFS